MLIEISYVDYWDRGRVFRTSSGEMYIKHVLDKNLNVKIWSVVVKDSLDGLKSHIDYIYYSEARKQFMECSASRHMIVTTFGIPGFKL